MNPEELLHLFGPFLPTDRFRALLRGHELPTTAQGAALMMDMSGFTPLASRLVDDFGPRRASEELKRRLNPMLEATAGQVFQHGGSVIRFVGDGFLAWFDDQPDAVEAETVPMPGILRATAAAFNMQSLMPIFRGLSLKIALAPGTAHRWVVGQTRYGLNDVLSGPAVEQMVRLIEDVEPGEIMVAADAAEALTSSAVEWQTAAVGQGLLIRAVPPEMIDTARRYRWPAWQMEADGQRVLEAVRPFVTPALRHSIENGFSDFVGELRQAFPMFIRINGLMAASQSSTDARLVLDQYVCDVQDVLAETGGRLVSVEISDKGSVLFAVFGAPVSYGDDAERALAAAMTFRDLAFGSPAAGSAISPQIGISRGPLYAGVVGGEVRHEYSTIGDETNVAARLMAAAQPGQIMVSSRVQDEVPNRIAFLQLPAIRIKGKEKPIAVSEPLFLSGDVARYVATDALIGRADELTQLRKLLRMVTAGLPRILQIEGQAGIGKSRLAEECQSLAIASQFRTLQTECVNTGGNIPYLPWRKVLGALFDLTSDLSAVQRAAKLSDSLVSANPDWLIRLPLLGDLLQLNLPGNSTLAGLSESSRQQALSSLVTEVIVYFARQQPLMLLIENVQWIDELSAKLLLDLAQHLNIEPSPVLLTVTCRPMNEAGRELTLDAALADLYIHKRMAIGDLSHEEVEQFIAHRLGAVAPAELSRFVYDQARGNPFFIQELLDVLEATQAIRVSRGKVRIEHLLNTVDLPRTIQGLIQAHFDRLSEGDKLVLKIASVIGRQFPVTLLTACVPAFMSQVQLLTHLQTLVERDFIYPISDDTEGSYLFSHAITHEVVYEGMLFAQRRQFHQSVGIALEAIQPNNIAQLAFHFARSGDEYQARARRYLRGSAQEAMRDYANQDALDYLGQALLITTDPEALFDIHQRRIDVLLRIGQVEPVAAALAEVQQLVDSAGRADWQALLHIAQARYRVARSEWVWVLHNARHALEWAREANADLLAWDALLLLSEAYRSVGDLQADEILRRDVRILAERLNDPYKDVQLLLKEIANLSSYQPQAAATGARNLLQLAETLNDTVLIADCWALIAELARAVFDLPAALAACQQQLARLRRIGARRYEGQVLNTIGLILIDLGQFSDASLHLQQAYTILHQIDERRGRAISLNALGTIASLRGAYEEGIAYLSRGLTQMRELSVAADIAHTLCQMADIRLRMTDPAAAELLLREALLLFEALQWPLPTAEVRMALAEVALQQGQIASAQTLIADLLPTLLEGSLSRLQHPGLNYWRAIQVCERAGQSEQARHLRHAFLRHHAAVISTFTDSTWPEAFNTELWYHQALLSVPPEIEAKAEATTPEAEAASRDLP